MSGMPMNDQTDRDGLLTLFLSGDVMTGRGIDQVLPHPSKPTLREPYVRNALEYVYLAMKTNGSFAYPVDFSYIWGDALKEWNLWSPNLKIINLETSITTSDDFWKGKYVHYRMNPENAPVLAVAKIDFCSLANNHVLDFGYLGLAETLQTLEEWKIKNAGAGRNLREASAPAILPARGTKVAVFAYGSESSGVPTQWEATDIRPGVNFLQDLSEKIVESIKKKIQETTEPENIVIVSIHWGGNWGFEISPAEVEFAHKLIDEAGVDVIHGHSSHHVKGIEVHNGKLVLYGCGDFVTDYEGIEGYEEFRGNLSLMYFAFINVSNGKLVRLHMIPTTMKRFQVVHASDSDTQWLKDTLNREGKRFGTRVNLTEKGGSLSLQWD